MIWFLGLVLPNNVGSAPHNRFGSHVQIREAMTVNDILLEIIAVCPSSVASTHLCTCYMLSQLFGSFVCGQKGGWGGGSAPDPPPSLAVWAHGSCPTHSTSLPLSEPDGAV